MSQHHSRVVMHFCEVVVVVVVGFVVGWVPKGWASAVAGTRPLGLSCVCVLLPLQGMSTWGTQGRGVVGMVSCMMLAVAFCPHAQCCFLLGVPSCFLAPRAPG